LSALQREHPMKTTAEIHDALLPWLATHIELELQFENLARVVGLADNNPLENTAYRVHQAYTEALSRELGDSFNWLHWFLYDNDRGKRGLEAKAPGWKKLRRIRNLHDLAKLILACVDTGPAMSQRHHENDANF
jgi:hypothetical protein